jgi:hypothetical protein
VPGHIASGGGPCECPHQAAGGWRYPRRRRELVSVVTTPNTSVTRDTGNPCRRALSPTTATRPPCRPGGANGRLVRQLGPVLARGERSGAGVSGAVLAGPDTGCRHGRPGTSGTESATRGFRHSPSPTKCDGSLAASARFPITVRLNSDPLPRRHQCPFRKFLPATAHLQAPRRHADDQKFRRGGSEKGRGRPSEMAGPAHSEG